MTKAEQFRENAEEAMQLCRRSRLRARNRCWPNLLSLGRKPRHWARGTLSVRRRQGFGWL